MARTPKLFSLDVAVVDALSARSKATGEAMSRIVEQGIRLALALPEPAPVEGDGGAADTRSMLDVLSVLKGMGPGPHLGHEVARRAQMTLVPTEKALGALARKGECHLWGHGGIALDDRGQRVRVMNSGFGPEGWMVNAVAQAWGIETPAERVGDLVAAWKAKGGKPLSFEDPPQEWVGRVANIISEIALSVDELEPVIAAVAPMGSREAWALENATTREARLNAEYAAKHPNG